MPSDPPAGRPDPVLKTVTLIEVGICCADLDRQIAFYRDVLGLTVHTVHDVPAEKSAPPGLAPAGYRIARLETHDGQRIKFAQPVPAIPPRTDDEWYVLTDQGVPYVSFLISDLDGLLARLAEARVPVLSGGEKFELREGVNIAVARDPEGNFLEFVE